MPPAPGGKNIDIENKGFLVGSWPSWQYEATRETINRSVFSGHHSPSKGMAYRVMGSSTAKTLRESVIAAQRALKKAQVNYQSALATVADTGVNDDGMFALRRGGRA